MIKDKKVTSYVLMMCICCIPTIIYQLMFMNSFFTVTEGWFSEYAYLIRQGMKPYTDFSLLLPPLYSLQIAGFQSLFGEGLIALHYLGLVVTCLIGIALFDILKQLFNGWIAVVSAAMIMLFYQSGEAYIGYDFTQFVTLYLLLAGVALVHYAKGRLLEKNTPHLFFYCFAVGLFFALAFLIKQSNAGVAIFFLGLTAISVILRLNVLRTAFLHLFWVGCGFVLPILAVLIWLVISGSLGDFFNSIFTDALASKGGLNTVLFRWMYNFFESSRYSLGLYNLLENLFYLIAMMMISLVLVSFIMAKVRRKNSPWNLMNPNSNNPPKNSVNSKVGKGKAGRKNSSMNLMNLKSNNPSISSIDRRVSDQATALPYDTKKYDDRAMKVSLCIQFLFCLLIVLIYNNEFKEYIFIPQVQKVGLIVWNNIMMWSMNLYFIGFLLAYIGFMLRPTIASAQCIVIFGICIALLFGNGTSAGVCEISLFVGVALLFAFLLQLSLLRGVVVLIPLVIFFSFAALLIETKFAFPYHWWATISADVRQQHCAKNVQSLFAGLCISDDQYNKVLQIQNDILAHSTATDSIYIFPHMPIFYLLTHRLPFAGAVVSWFDFMSDRQALAVADKLLKSPPAVIVVAEIPEMVLLNHEYLFRGAKKLAQREILNVINYLELNHVIQRIDTIHDLNGFAVNVYVLKHLAV